MKKKNNKKNNKFGFLTLYLVVAIVAIVLMLISLRLFTGNWIITSGYPDKFDYSKGASLGDIINGLTAPVLTLVATFILVHTLLKQIEANRQLKDEIDTSNFFKSYYEIISLIEASGKALADYKEKKIAIFSVNNKGEIIDNIVRDINSIEFDSLFTYIRLVDETTRSIEMLDDPNDSFHFTDSKPGFNFKSVLRLKTLGLVYVDVKSDCDSIMKADYFKMTPALRSLKKSAESIHDRFERSYSPFWGCNTEKLSLKFFEKNANELKILFNINEENLDVDKKAYENDDALVVEELIKLKYMQYLFTCVAKFFNRKMFIYKEKVANYISSLYFIEASYKTSSNHKRISTKIESEWCLSEGNNYYRVKLLKHPSSEIKRNGIIKIMRAK